MSRRKHKPGEVRVAVSENGDWYGFHVQRGHLFGLTPHGIYFVTALVKTAAKTFKVYLHDPKWNTRINEWRAVNMYIGGELGQLCLKAALKRADMGITGVEFSERKKYETGYNPRLTTEYPMTPYSCMYIPSGGYAHNIYRKDPVTGEWKKSAAATW